MISPDFNHPPPLVKIPTLKSLLLAHRRD
uniref:Uncharacterized protein n=1 Tax=Anguilla anguilla TaxID=7936 RepID=A0A0E9PDF2_ANGAN